MIEVLVAAAAVLAAAVAFLTLTTWHYRDRWRSTSRMLSVARSSRRSMAGAMSRRVGALSRRLDAATAQLEAARADADRQAAAAMWATQRLAELQQHVGAVDVGVDGPLPDDAWTGIVARLSDQTGG